MINTIDEVWAFVERNPDYKPQLGIVKTRRVSRDFLSWAAVHTVTGHQQVPYLSSICKLHPGAYWKPLTPEELRDYLSRNQEKAFLLSQQMEQRKVASPTADDRFFEAVYSAAREADNEPF